MEISWHESIKKCLNCPSTYLLLCYRHKYICYRQSIEFLITLLILWRWLINRFQFFNVHPSLSHHPPRSSHDNYLYKIFCSYKVKIIFQKPPPVHRRFSLVLPFWDTIRLNEISLIANCWDLQLLLPFHHHCWISMMCGSVILFISVADSTDLLVWANQCAFRNGTQRNTALSASVPVMHSREEASPLYRR